MLPAPGRARHTRNRGPAGHQRNVFSMAGGIRGWRDKHLPEEKPPDR
jgi:rhodanese-related sulfurtransferase